MKRNLLVTVTIICLLLSAGCSKLIQNRSEIVNNTFINVVGIDWIKEADKFKITITSKRLSGGGGGGESGEKSSVILSSEGRTIFEAVRNFHSYSDKRIFWGHTEFILIGEQAAKANILKPLDFFTRDSELRLNAKALVVREGTAEDVIKNTNLKSFFLVDRLNNLTENAGALSISGDINLVELMNLLDSDYSSAYMPTISLVDRELKGEEDKGKKDVELNGYGIFEGVSLSKYLLGNTARGINWVLKNVRTGIIVVKDSKGENISLEIISATSKIRPKISDGNLSVTIEVGMSSNIGEIQSTTDVFDKNSIAKLRKQQGQIIKGEITQAVKTLQETNTDILGIGDAFYHKYPIEWQKLKSKWAEVFPKLEIDIEVNSIINRSYTIKQPTRSKVSGE